MPVLAECNVGNVCRSRRASNAAGEEQRANHSMLRLGHQAPHRLAEGVWVAGVSRRGWKVAVTVVVGGGSFPF